MKRLSSIVILFLMFIILGIGPIAGNPGTTLSVIPANTINSTLQYESPQTIRPMADGTFKDWTRNTLTIRPNGGGTFNDPKNWTGKVLTLNPSGHGTSLSPPSSQWSSWIQLIPNANGDFGNWTGYGGSVLISLRDWPTNDGDSTYAYTTINNYNQSLGFEDPPPQAVGLSISKVVLTMVAKSTVASQGKIRQMLAIGKVMYNGSIYQPGTSYVTYKSEWFNNPATGSAWTWPDIISLQAGMRSQQIGAGQLRVTQLYVSVLANGLYTQWNDWPNYRGDGDKVNGYTDYVGVSARNQYQISSLPDHSPTSDTWSILKVRVAFVAKMNASASLSATIVIISGGNAYTGGTFALTTTYTEYASEWETNPNGGLAWTWSAIDTLQVGVMSVGPSNWPDGVETRVTQLYAQVIEPGTYTYWSEATQDGDATYVSAISGNRVRSSALENHVGQTWTISKVQVSIIARTEGSTNKKATPLLVIGGVAYLGTSSSLTTAYETYSSVWTQNPSTHLAWTWSDIDALEAGVKSIQTIGTTWKGEARVTQLYVVVCEAGSYAEWDEASQDGDSSYLSATMGGMLESSVLQNITQPYPAGTIARVRVVIYTKATVATDERVQPLLVMGGSQYYSNISYSLTTDYTKYVADWGRNPTTGGHWAWSEVDALEAGVLTEAGNDNLWTGELRITQLYVEVALVKFSVTVNVGEATDLYTADFRLNYTTTVLTATGIFFGSFFPPLGDSSGDSRIWEEDINDTAGSLRYMTGLIGLVPGVSGSGTLATIDFITDSYGKSALALCEIEFVDHLYQVIPITLYSGYFDNRIPGDITGPENPPGSGNYPYDGKVDTYDLAYLGKKFGTSDPVADFTGPENPPSSGTYPPDGTVNTYDLAALGKNFGKHYP